MDASDEARASMGSKLPSRAVVHYVDRAEAEKAHPALDISAPMPKTELVITDSYEYPERRDWVGCQLEIDGKICREPHGNGWFMMRRDGKEGYVGGDCAKRHFKADKEFAKAVARAGRDIRTGNLRTRLGSLVQDREALRRKILEELERQQTLHVKVKALRQMLPYPALTQLHQMGKTGNRIVRVDLGYLEKDEDRDQKVIEVMRWRPEVVGAVAAPHALDVGSIEAIGVRLRAGLAACMSADPNAEKADKELRRWADAIDDVDRCKADLVEATSALGSFAEPTNIGYLCWVCPKDEDQVEVARAVLRLAGSRDVTDSAAVRARNTWRKEIMIARKAQRFKVL
jgi:hypothetical protein